MLYKSVSEKLEIMVSINKWLNPLKLGHFSQINYKINRFHNF